MGSTYGIHRENVKCIEHFGQKTETEEVTLEGEPFLGRSYKNLFWDNRRSTNFFHKSCEYCGQLINHYLFKEHPALWN
jgi:hypothetical protein